MGSGGFGGVRGNIRFGQPHEAVAGSGAPVFGVADMMADVSTASMKASPMVGNLSDIIPR